MTANRRPRRAGSTARIALDISTVVEYFDFHGNVAQMTAPEAIAAFAALANDTRLAVFRRLVAAGPGGLAAGAVAAGTPPSTLSHHLAALTAAGLVDVRHAGRSIIYAARLDGIRDLVAFVTDDCCGGHPEVCGLRPPPTVTIYHNPACGTSRNVLAMICATGVEPRVIEYLKTPPDRATLEALIAAIGGGARAVLRQGPAYHDLGLDDEWLRDATLIDDMLEHPILIERPIVVTPKGTALCRPSERVLDLLDGALPAGFVKEDGSPVAPR